MRLLQIAKERVQYLYKIVLSKSVKEQRGVMKERLHRLLNERAWKPLERMFETDLTFLNSLLLQMSLHEHEGVFPCVMRLCHVLTNYVAVWRIPKNSHWTGRKWLYSRMLWWKYRGTV
jgi:hypothetical protein